jgi:hypothetical protein
MAFLASVLKVMIASPSDVATERQIVRDVLSVWNGVHGQEKKMVALPIGWETHSIPDLGDRPQAIVNKQILADCDLLVAIFWTRLGSPTGKAVSGTVEEIEEHLNAGKHAMLYFSNAVKPPNEIDYEQYAALNQFKAACRARGLVESYQSVDEFREKFHRQFSQNMNQIRCEPSVAEIEAAYQLGKQPDSPSLSDAAATLLRELIADGRGRLLRTHYAEGVELHVNKKQLIVNQDARTIARWDEAIRELESRGLIRELMHLNPHLTEYKLTDTGFHVADVLGDTTRHP